MRERVSSVRIGQGWLVPADDEPVFLLFSSHGGYDGGEWLGTDPATGLMMTDFGEVDPVADVATGRVKADGPLGLKALAEAAAIRRLVLAATP